MHFLKEDCVSLCTCVVPLLCERLGAVRAARSGSPPPAERALAAVECHHVTTLRCVLFVYLHLSVVSPSLTSSSPRLLSGEEQEINIRKHREDEAN